MSNEYLYPSHYNLISITDTNSYIKYSSPHFSEVAGYKDNELIGHAHNIIRHPDMPKDAFADLWKHIKNGKPWMGMVKNRRTDGQYYWVDAYASPVFKDGKIYEYQSVRTTPERTHVNRAEKIYKQVSKGQTPLRLLLPRTKLWVRIVLSLAITNGLFSFFLSANNITISQNSYSLIMLVITALVTFILTRPLESLAKQARTEFNNPLMELIYTGKVNDISEVALAYKMRKSKASSIVSRVRVSVMDTCMNVFNKAHKVAQHTENGCNQLTRTTSQS